MSDNSTNTFVSYINQLPKFANYVVGITLVCYMAGFAISNIYFGSLGIVNLDVLRTRYVLVGFLFMLFLGATAYLIAGLFQTIMKHYYDTAPMLVRNVFQYSLVNLSVMYFVVLAITALAGSVNILPVGLPRISQPAPWSDWLNHVPGQVLVISTVTVALVVLTVTLIIAALIVVNPKGKDAVRTSRKQKLGDLFTGLRKDGIKFLGGIVFVFLVVFVILCTGSLIHFLTTNSLSETHSTDGVFSGGWGRYLGGISVLYGFAAAYLVTIVIFRKANNSVEDSSKEKLMSPLSSTIVLVALAISLIMPLYANGIYPNLPQQVGGGQVIKVELRLSDVEIRPLILNPDTEVYLLDRTNSSTLLLLIDKNTAKYQAAEIPNSSIQSIIYNAMP